MNAMRQQRQGSWNSIAIGVFLVVLLLFLHSEWPTNWLFNVLPQIVLLFTSASLIRKIMYELALGYGGIVAPLTGCVIALLPTVGPILAILIGWKSTLYSILGTLFWALFFGFLYRAKRRLNLQSINDVSHPYSPDVDWIIAVSRRFNIVPVEKLYKEDVLPVLMENAIVVECRYAGENSDSPDFWLTRMNLILEIADIHIIMEHQPSSATLSERFYSAQFLRTASNAYLKIIFGEDHKIASIQMRPFAIHLRDRKKRSSINYAKNSASIYLPMNGGGKEFRQKLRDYLRQIKKSRMICFHPDVVRAAGVRHTFISSAENRDQEIEALSLRTKLARLLSSPQGSIEHARFVTEVFEKSGDSKLRALNKFTELSLRFQNGERLIPARFSSTYKVLWMILEARFGKDDWRTMRYFLAPYLLFTTFYLRWKYKEMIGAEEDMEEYMARMWSEHN
ncbi:MAG: hypothetical protein V7641_980 [Blastocatellia bacterium]